MQNSEKLAKEYVREVSKYIVCTKAKKYKLLSGLSDNVIDYIENNKVEYIEDVHSHFGSPEAVAKTFIENGNLAQVKKSVNLKRIIIIVAIIIVTMLAVYLGISFADGHQLSNGYTVDTPIVEVTELQ